MESCIILDETYLMLRHHDSNKEIKILSENLYLPMSAHYFLSISLLSNIIQINCWNYKKIKFFSFNKL